MTSQSGSGGASTLSGDTDVVLSSPASNDLLRYDGAHWVNAQSGLYRIGQKILGVATTTVTFSGIAGSYSELRLVVYGRSNLAAVSDDINIRFNSDTGANYDYQTFQAAGAALAGSEHFGTAFGYAGALPGASAPANVGTMLVLTIPFYANTTFQKQCLAQGGDKQGLTTTQIFIRHSNSWWRNTAAINRIDLLSSTTGQFIAGSLVNLYGIV